MSQAKKTQAIIQLISVLGILIFLNILGRYFYTYWDLTEEKRYTITEPTKDLLESIEEVVHIRVLLGGEYPAGFKRLQTATREILDDFRSINGLVDYTFEDPSSGTVQENNQQRENLNKIGINPTNLRFKDVSETREQMIYPWAIVYYKGREFNVNLLESEVLGSSSEQVLNNSISLLEYKFANAFQKLELVKKPVVVFTKGHGELRPLQQADLVKTLIPFYNVGYLDLDSIYQVSPEIGVLVIAKPRVAFSPRDKFIVDQYVMNGGRVIFMLDQMNVDLDSLRQTADYIPQPRELDLEDLLFKYGARVQPNLILDFECTRIPQVIGQLGSGAQMDLFPWYYHPLVQSASDHPIVKNLDRVNLFFPSTIDTIRTKTPVKKTILLASSNKSRVQFPPVRLNFEILRYDPDPTKFNKPPQPVAVLLEGQLSSLYENRVDQNMLRTLEQIGASFKGSSEGGKVIVVSDGDLAKNQANPANETYSPMGFNKYENFVFGGNKDFMINAIEYLMDDKGVIEARTKEVKLRLLDTTRTLSEATQWRLLNIVMPLVFLALFGFGYTYWRKRKYAS